MFDPIQSAYRNIYSESKIQKFSCPLFEAIDAVQNEEHIPDEWHSKQNHILEQLKQK